MVSKPFHVVWADRIGLTDRWKRDLDFCSETYGTKFYIERVAALRNDIINISGEGNPKLSDQIDEYINGPLKKWANNEYDTWRNKHRNDARIDAHRRKEKKQIYYNAMKHLHKFIIQLLEDNGFGTYKTKVSEDEVSLNGNNSSNDYVEYDIDEEDLMN